jgi:hypothetical protein
MQSDAKLQRREPKNHPKGLRNRTGFLWIALAVGIALFFFELREEDRVDDDPALDALLRAQSHLAQSYRPEQDVLSQSQAAHRELKAAIDLLAAARQEDPAATQKVEDLRAELQALESQKDIREMTSEELQARYRKLRTELKALIEARLKRNL